MKSISNSWNRFRTSQSLKAMTAASKGLPLEVVVVGKKDQARFDGLLESKHYLGKGQPGGDYLRQVVIEDGKWVGLLAWGSACYRIKDRDQWIGWTNTQRAERLKLVVQNRRFLLLHSKGQRPHLASAVLGKALRELPLQWEESFGY